MKKMNMLNKNKTESDSESENEPLETRTARLNAEREKQREEFENATKKSANYNGETSDVESMYTDSKKTVANIVSLIGAKNEVESFGSFKTKTYDLVAKVTGGKVDLYTSEINKGLNKIKGHKKTLEKKLENMQSSMYGTRGQKGLAIQIEEETDIATGFANTIARSNKLIAGYRSEEEALKDDLKAIDKKEAENPDVDYSDDREMIKIAQKQIQKEIEGTYADLQNAKGKLSAYDKGIITKKGLLAGVNTVYGQVEEVDRALGNGLMVVKNLLDSQVYQGGLVGAAKDAKKGAELVQTLNEIENIFGPLIVDITKKIPDMIGPMSQSDQGYITDLREMGNNTQQRLDKRTEELVKTYSTVPIK
ncbi:MAG: hypothetical protein ABH828_00315 [archaeon]